MPGLIDDLKNDHQLILHILDEVKKFGISGSIGREKLLSAKALLLSHIRKEDELFYPALHQAAEQSSGLRNTLQYFSEDMERVSRTAMDLFDKYAGGDSSEDFSGEITLLYMTLKDRIRTEEDVLFRKFEQGEREKKDPGRP